MKIVWRPNAPWMNRKTQQIMIRKAGYESQARNLVNGTIDVPKIKQENAGSRYHETMQPRTRWWMCMSQKKWGPPSVETQQVMMERKTETERAALWKFLNRKQNMQRIKKLMSLCYTYHRGLIWTRNLDRQVLRKQGIDMGRTKQEEELTWKWSFR